MGRGGENDTAMMGMCGGCCCFLFLFVFLPMSFSGCEYYEACITKRRSTSTVDTESPPYAAGNYFLGPDKYFVAFPVSAQDMKFEDLSVWSKVAYKLKADGTKEITDAGVSLFLDVSMQYKLKTDKIGEIYRQFALNYDQPIRNFATEALKQEATQHSADDYLTKRFEVEKRFRNVTAAVIEEHGNAILVDLQLRAVTFRSQGTVSFVQSKLRAAIQNEKNDQEEFKKQATLIRSQTKTEKEVITNNANQAREKATARATLLAAQAQNEAAKRVELARNGGLNQIYTDLNLHSPAQKASLDYLLTLSSSSGNNMFVDFEQANAFQ